jgi:hypothetical protein
MWPRRIGDGDRRSSSCLRSADKAHANEPSCSDRYRLASARTYLREAYANWSHVGGLEMRLQSIGR